MAGYVVADATFDFGPTGKLVAGTIYRADDPLVKDHPDWFTDLDQSPFLVTSVHPDKPKDDSGVEQATAAPGEKRTTKRASSS